jgi:hypothetical protein
MSRVKDGERVSRSDYNVIGKNKEALERLDR